MRSVPALHLDNSTMTIGEDGTLDTDDLVLTNNTIFTNPAQKKLDFDLQSLFIDTTSTIFANGKGYPEGQGPGKGEFASNPTWRFWGGGGYGGRGGGEGRDLVLGDRHTDQRWLRSISVVVVLVVVQVAEPFT